MTQSLRARAAKAGRALALGAAVVLSPPAAAHDGPGAAVAYAPAVASGDGSARRWTDERVRFVAARRALAKGDTTRFTTLESGLAASYPLHPYLLHERLASRFRRGRPTLADLGTIETFEEATGDAVLAARLVRVLQRRLARLGRWHDFLAVGEASRHAAAMPCTTLVARERTAPPAAFDEASLALWIEPVEHGKDCRKALAALEARDTPPVAAIWERIYQAMEADRPAFAERVLGYLSTRDRRPVEGWIAAAGNPGAYLRSGAVDADGVLERRIVADLVLDWSETDPVAAMEYWRRVRDRYAFYDDRRYETERALAMRGAYRRLPEAQGWLEAFEARPDDLEAMEWRVRTALLAGDWDAVVRALGRLPPEEREEDHWAYWDARALEVAGRGEEARAIYARIADLQSWHGFLAAERLGRPHAIEEIPIEPDAETLARLARTPALVRAREYHAVGLAHEGRREWNAWLAAQDAEAQAAAAVLAARWGLHDRAIFSAGRAERREALSLRFPVLYADEVTAAAREHGLRPAWIHGVMRRESAYIPDIRSGAGAIGLMQLMPATARDVARRRGLGDGWRGDLTDPETNIAFGSFYLRHVLDRFDGHPVLATAAYNAGPHRVKRWLPERGAMEADRWIDTIPFTETRRYVRAVFAYAAIYEHRLNGRPYHLADRLLPVPSGRTTPSG